MGEDDEQRWSTNVQSLFESVKIKKKDNYCKNRHFLTLIVEIHSSFYLTT